MFRTATVILMLLSCCYCLDDSSNELEDGRAKKKKSPARLWALLLFLGIAKVAVVKVVSFFLFAAFFQKVFYFLGLFLKHYLKAPKAPQTAYGPPQDYNTVGYSYGPPEHEALMDHENLPSITELGGSLNWLFNKNAN
ncbi:unnamed protein product [Diatraea saccharalis]|uniref:Uncharacterized protein n=1 Tax=Diatraea saccharalis TaxID=40085 RepID=A0A9N9REM6_9NEOP|nr:unnamed protein product [Diatraea saccharalis]